MDAYNGTSRSRNAVEVWKMPIHINEYGERQFSASRNNNTNARNGLRFLGRRHYLVGDVLEVAGILVSNIFVIDWQSRAALDIQGGCRYRPGIFHRQSDSLHLCEH